MTTYISLLRGINVSGQKKVKMDALRMLYENLNFHYVKTYIQSGNVIFKAPKSSLVSLEQAIGRRISDEFGFHVGVIVLTMTGFKQIIDDNPLLKAPGINTSFLHVTFLSSKPANYDKKRVEDKIQDGEKISFSDKAVYLYCPNGYGQTKLNNNLIEAQLKVQASTRNWKTANQLLGIALAMNT